MCSLQGNAQWAFTLLVLGMSARISLLLNATNTSGYPHRPIVGSIFAFRVALLPNTKHEVPGYLCKGPIVTPGYF